MWMFVTFLAFLTLQSHGSQGSPSIWVDVFKISRSVATFSQNFYRETSEKDKSLVYSPFSIHSAFFLASVGARHQSQEEMAQVLGTEELLLPLEAEGSILTSLSRATKAKVEVGNAIFLNPMFKLKSDFVRDAVYGFEAKADYLDFTDVEATPEKRVNDFVSNKTHGVIKEVLEKHSITAETVLVMLNTVYFNATWERKFSPMWTSKQDFHRSDGSITKVDMMGFPETVTVSLRHDEQKEIDTLKLPYQGGRFSFFIVMPRNPKAMEVLESSSANLQKAIDNFQHLTETSDTVVSIPKFKVKSDLDLKEILPKLGMSKAFTPGEADFSGMTDSEVSISSAKHQAVITVQEYGTEAAAATTITFTRTSAPLVKDRFIANRPFLFFIQDKMDGNILLQGKFVGQ